MYTSPLQQSSRNHHSTPSTSSLHEGRKNNPPTDAGVLRPLIRSVSSSSEPAVLIKQQQVSDRPETDQSSDDPAEEVLRALFSDKKGDVQLTEITVQGRDLMNEAERLRFFREQQAMLHPPRFRLTRLRACLTGIALVGSTVGGYIFSQRQSGKPDSTDTSVQDGPLPTPLAMRAATDTEVNVPFDDELMQGDQPQSASTLHPWRGYLPEPEEQGNAFLLQKKNTEIIYFLQRMSLLDSSKKPVEFTKEEMLVAMANYLATDDPQRKLNLARIIMQAADLYGGNQNEPQSLSQTESINRNWLFENVLGTSPDRYVAEKVSGYKDPAGYSVSAMSYLLSAEGLQNADKVNFKNLSNNNRLSLMKIWQIAVQKELPLLFYYGRDPLVKDLPLTDKKFAFLFTGSRFLDDHGINLREIDAQEVINTGKAMWEIAIYNGVSLDMLKYYSTPALFWGIIKQKTDIATTGNGFVYKLDTLNKYLEYGLLEQIFYEDLMNKINDYKLATKQWMPRGKLAETIIKDCPPQIIKSCWLKVPVFKEKKYEYCSDRAKESYLNGIKKPCETAPDSVTVQYEILTRQLASSLADVDEFIIFKALASLEKRELDFIYAEDAVIRNVNSDITWKGRNLFQKKIGLIRTDLFSVTLSNKVRIYALKGEEGEYKCIRVDRNLDNYIKNGLYDIDLKGKQYRIENNQLFVPQPAGSLYPTMIYRQYISYTNNIEKAIKKKGELPDKLIKYLKNKHEGNFYQAIYDAGYDPTGLKKFWDFSKHFIPFYDCTDNIIKGDAAEALGPCMLDVISLVPVVGQATSLGARFGVSLARGMRAGAFAFARSAITKNTLKTAGRQLAKEIVLPTVSELSSLGLNALRAADPGVELMALAGKTGLKSSQKIVQYIKEIKTGPDANTVIKKMESALSSQKYPSSVKTDLMARLPDSDFEVPVKKIGKSEGQDIVAIINPETGEVAGRRYRLDNSNLEINNMFPFPPQQPIQYLPRAARIDVRAVAKLESFISTMSVERARNLVPEMIDPGIMESIATNYGTNEIYVHRLSDSLESIPQEYNYLRTHLLEFQNEIDQAIEQTKRASQILRENYRLDPLRGPLSLKVVNPVTTYMRVLLKTRNAEIINAAVKRLFDYVDNMNFYFGYNKKNMLLATSRRTGTNYEYRVSIPNGVTYFTDRYSQIVLMVDNFDNPASYNNAMSLTTLHEASHTAGSRDVFCSASTTRVGSNQDNIISLNEIITGIDQEFSLPPGDIFIDTYARKVNIPSPNIEDFKQLIKNDPMLKANVIMDNADVISRMIEDIAMERRASDFIRNKRETSKTGKVIGNLLHNLFIYGVLSEKPSENI